SQSGPSTYQSSTYQSSTYQGDDVIEASTRATEDLSQAGAEIRERDRVRITSLAREGTVEAISGDEYTVLVGALRFRARRDEIELLSRGAKPASSRAAALPRGVSADLRADVDASGDFTPEINLIGSTTDEATDRTDKFLDEAFLAGAESVRIIHGH